MPPSGSLLAPTLWRTCRALANIRRLRLLRHLIIENTCVSVTEVAREIGTNIPWASQGLRALNARGLLGVEREGRFVRYRVAHDPKVPYSLILLTGLKHALRRPGNSIEDTFSALTGFTHPRRIALVRAVSKGAGDRRTISRQIGLSYRAAGRHLAKLVRRGYLVRKQKRYCLARPKAPLPRVLLRIALHDT